VGDLISVAENKPPKAGNKVNKSHTCSTWSFRRLRLLFVCFILDDQCVCHIREGEREKEEHRNKERKKEGRKERETYRRIHKILQFFSVTH
jgi:hypothetical protein